MDSIPATPRRGARRCRSMTQCHGRKRVVPHCSRAREPSESAPDRKTVGVHPPLSRGRLDGSDADMCIRRGRPVDTNCDSVRGITAVVIGLPPTGRR